MQTNHDHTIDLSQVIGAIPDHLKGRFHKEIHHAFSTNLCVYEGAYVTYTVIHFTSAESQHVALAVEEIKAELLEGGWHLAHRQTDPQFIEVYLASIPHLVEPLNLSAFVEATGLDISEVRAPMPVPDSVPNFYKRLPEHNVSGMKVLEQAETAQQVLAVAFGEHIELPKLVATSTHGPHVLVQSKRGEMFGVWPTFGKEEEPLFRFGIVQGEHVSSEVMLHGYSELVLHFGEFLEQEKTRRFQMFRRLTESHIIRARYNVEYRFDTIAVTERDSDSKSVKIISEEPETTSLFKVEIVSETNGTTSFVATADDMENLLLSH